MVPQTLLQIFCGIEANCALVLSTLCVTICPVWKAKSSRVCTLLSWWPISGVCFCGWFYWGQHNQFQSKSFCTILCSVPFSTQMQSILVSFQLLVSVFPSSFCVVFWAALGCKSSCLHVDLDSSVTTDPFVLTAGSFNVLFLMVFIAVWLILCTCWQVWDYLSGKLKKDLQYQADVCLSVILFTIWNGYRFTFGMTSC